MKKTFLLLMFFSAQNCFAQQEAYITYKPCAFSVSLPVTMKPVKMYEDKSLDYCDYQVNTKSGIMIELHAMSRQRSETDDLNEMYTSALQHIDMDVSYKTIVADFFVISGTDNRTGRIVYWKRFVGNRYISDLRIEYDKNNKSAIEHHLGKISKSFRCD
jgi:hypothetical protein